MYASDLVSSPTSMFYSFYICLIWNYVDIFQMQQHFSVRNETENESRAVLINKLQSKLKLQAAMEGTSHPAPPTGGFRKTGNGK